jgi:RNA recognition motif-containing protein
MSGKLYVGNLAFSVSDEQPSEFFTGANIPVENVRLVRDVDTGRSRGFAFFQLAPEGDVERAIKELNGKTLEGRPLTVSEARPQKKRDFDRGPSGGGAYGRREFGNRSGGGGNRDRGRGRRNNGLY